MFSVGPEFADDFADRELSERWANEFKKRQIELKDPSYITPREQGWMIRPGVYGGERRRSEKSAQRSLRGQTPSKPVIHGGVKID